MRVVVASEVDHRVHDAFADDTKSLGTVTGDLKAVGSSEDERTSEYDRTIQDGGSEHFDPILHRAGSDEACDVCGTGSSLVVDAEVDRRVHGTSLGMVTGDLKAAGSSEYERTEDDGT